MKLSKSPAKDNKEALAGRQPSHRASLSLSILPYFPFLFVYIKFTDIKVKDQLHKFTGLQKDSAHKTERKRAHWQENASKSLFWAFNAQKKHPLGVERQ